MCCQYSPSACRMLTCRLEQRLGTSSSSQSKERSKMPQWTTASLLIIEEGPPPDGRGAGQIEPCNPKPPRATAASDKISSRWLWKSTCRPELVVLGQHELRKCPSFV